MPNRGKARPCTWCCTEGAILPQHQLNILPCMLQPSQSNIQETILFDRKGGTCTSSSVLPHMPSHQTSFGTNPPRTHFPYLHCIFNLQQDPVQVQYLIQDRLASLSILYDPRAAAASVGHPGWRWHKKRYRRRNHESPLKSWGSSSRILRPCGMSWRRGGFSPVVRVSSPKCQT